MKECCESGAPGKKRGYGVWAALAVVVFTAVVLQLLPEQRFDHGIASQTMARVNVMAIRSALDEYAHEHDGQYPASLAPLVAPDAKGHCALEGFNGHIPRDPWKREYLYEPPHTGHPAPRVLSLGKDGQRGGSGDDEDVDSDHLKDE